MKPIRILCAIVCFALMFCLFESIAEGDRYETLCTYEDFTYTDAEVDGKHVFVVTNYRAKAGLITDDGQLRAWLECNLIHYESNGFFSVMSLVNGANNRSLLSAGGEMLTESQYADFETISESWVAAIKISKTESGTYDYRNIVGAGNYIITAVDIYHFELGSSNGGYIGTLTRSQYYHAKAVSKDYLLVEERDGNLQLYNAMLEPIDSNFDSIYNSMLFCSVTESDICVVSRLDGEVIASGIIDIEPADGTDDRYWVSRKFARHYGYDPIYALMDADGNILTDFTYIKKNGNRNGYCVVANGQKRGLMRLSDGGFAVECRYDDILLNANYKGYIHNGYIAVVIDDKIGYIDVGDHETCPALYPQNEFTVMGCTMYKVDPDDGSYTIVSADGVVTNIPYSIGPDAYSDDGYFIIVQDESGKSALIDWHGEIVFPFTDSRMRVYGNDCIIVDKTLYRLIR